MILGETTIKQAKELQVGDVFVRAEGDKPVGATIDHVFSFLDGLKVAIHFTDGGMLIVHRDYAFVVAA